MFSKEKVSVTYVVERCQLCKFEKKRNYKEGDYVFANTIKCNSCDGMMQIDKIFGEILEN
jgi:hypothetical protein